MVHAADCMLFVSLKLSEVINCNITVYTVQTQVSDTFVKLSGNFVDLVVDLYL